MKTAVAPPGVPMPAVLDVRAVAALLDCSARHVFRLADAGKMPAPVKVGHLVRWRRTDIDNWVSAGCPACQTEER